MRPGAGWRPIEQSPLGPARSKAAPPHCDFARCSGPGVVRTSSPPGSKAHFVHPRDSWAFLVSCGPCLWGWGRESLANLGPRGCRRERKWEELGSWCLARRRAALAASGRGSGTRCQPTRLGTCPDLENVAWAPHTSRGRGSSSLKCLTHSWLKQYWEG